MSGPTTFSSKDATGVSSIRGRAENHQLRANVSRRGLGWLDFIVALAAAGGLTVSALYNVQFRNSIFAASDFKTLYASVWCFAHHLNAYSIPNLQKVFIANGVIQPERWYGHAPVYPWTTLATLIPFSALGMVAAMYAFTIASGTLWGLAVFGLMRYAARNFNLEIGWRIAIAFLCACGPLLAFGLDVGNVSIAVSALCFLAFALRSSGPYHRQLRRWWLCAGALALAFLLKPHVALWVGVGMALLPERAGRAVVVRAGALVAGFAAVTATVMAAAGVLGMETHSYLAMLASETSAGASMNATSREILPVVAQITSFDSIAGFWMANPLLRAAVTVAVLLALGYVLLRQTRRVQSERGAMLAIGTWCLLGMLATYHRAHDAVVLLVIVPWVIDRIRRAPLDWHAWVAAVLYSAMSASVAFPRVVQWVDGTSKYSVEAFVLLRQVGLAALLLFPVLVFAMKRDSAAMCAAEDTGYEEASGLRAAA